MTRLLLVPMLILGASAVAFSQQAGPPLAAVQSWGYQLGEIDTDEIAGSGFDLVVVDYSRDGTDESAFSASDVATLQTKPDGSRRIVLAYLSVGEAEDYRYYWNRAWARSPPAWLGAENPRWKGNYEVRFWDPDWQRLLFGTRDAYVDKILRAGFDGVYLDLVDAYESFADERPQAEGEMVAMVRALSRYANMQRRGFYVFAQNGEPLAAHQDFLSAIDGLAKEELFFGHNGTNAPTPAAETQLSIGFLQRIKKAGKVVLTVDYTSNRAALADVYERSRREGFVPYATHRDLDRLSVNPLDPPRQRPIAIARQSLPGQFFAVVAPRGVWRTSVFADTWRESVTADSAAPEAAENLREWTYGVAIGLGVGRGWEIGLRLPLVEGEFQMPGVKGRRSRGLGNIGIAAARSWQSRDGARNLLASIEADVPTDSRSDDFRPGPQVGLSVTAEHYWDRIGGIASATTRYQAADGWSKPEIIGAWSAGIGFQATERAYTSVHLGGEQTTLRTEIDAELLLSRNKSIEFFIGRDVSGPADATFFGVGFSLWIDPVVTRTPQQ